MAQLTAQSRVVAVGPDGQPTVITEAGQPVPAQPASASGKPDPKADPSKAAEPGKEGDKKDAEPPPPKVVRRDDASDETSDPKEFNTLVGEDGRVAFEFRNQRWVDLVQWLADISDKPLDWLELPGDRVNLRSPGRYTVEETRDLFNRYLLARGYTLLEIDGGLTVAKTATINPAIVPRVDVTTLATLPPHTFVPTSLDVGWLSADKLSQELAPMISGNGKLTALSTTNRIEAMDAAVNLRQIAMLLDQERSSASLEALAPEFKPRYLSAEEAKLMLEQFLGVEKKQEAPMTPQQIQMMQQMRGQNPNNPAPPEPKQEISIVANTRQNSVIIRAPVDRTAIAMEFLKRIDVPSESMASLADIQTRVQVFRLASLDPEKLIEIVSEMNVLEPTTRVRVDKDNNALIVSGSAADRYVIDTLIKLGELPPPGGSRNTVRIIDASPTPETYEYLQRLRQQWSQLSPNPLELPDSDQFNEPNEAPPGKENSEQDEADESVKPTEPSKDAAAIDDSLAGVAKSATYQFAVAQVGTTRDIGPDDSRPAAQTEEAAETPALPELPPIRSSDDFRRAFQQPRQSESETPNDRNQTPAVVRIGIDRAGNLVLVSPDTAALDQLENLMLQVSPPKRPYQVFHIEHASAYWMRLNLEDYFKDLEEEDSGSDEFTRWYFGFDTQQDDKGPNGLGKGVKLRFVDDPDTNTLVINGATSEQLRTISELIELWDVPEPVNKRKTRFTRLVQVEFGTAEKISETVKEAYRDLLSSNDKAFTSGSRGQNSQGGGGEKADASKSRDGNGSSL